jgi:hypothetical protein
MTEPVELLDKEDKEPVARRDSGPGRVRLGAVIAIALLIGFGVWLAVRHESASSHSPLPAQAAAVAVSPAGLKTLADAVGQPIYWAGPKPGFTYEMTKTADNRVWIRYLPVGTKLGSSSPYLTIGTYPLQDAYALTLRRARQSGSVRLKISGKGIAFYGASAPTNVYLAYPGSNYQVEVYDPSGSTARELVRSGAIAAVSPGASAATIGAEAASVTRLKTLSASLHHPIYWIGAKSGVTYELTKTTDGRIYIRYLPSGAQPGTGKAYLTIGTYPFANAYTLTRALLRKPGSVAVKVGGGGVAVYNQARPTNVYIAFPHVDFQIEVFDPSSARAQKLVASNSVTPVG